MFQLNTPVVIRPKVKKSEQTLLFTYSHALLRIHIISGQRSVRIVPLSLPSLHGSPATRDIQFSISVERSSEIVFWICRASFTNSSCPLPNGPPWLSLPSGLGGGSPMHALLQLISLCMAIKSQLHSHFFTFVIVGEVIFQLKLVTD